MGKQYLVNNDNHQINSLLTCSTFLVKFDGCLQN